ncbi:MAG: hypothetical protein JWM99_1250 [Verrucomicrobiales bacterium]|nr:hypothetical protein [Verrucomicrobiales bacterium]
MFWLLTSTSRGTPLPESKVGNWPLGSSNERYNKLLLFKVWRVSSRRIHMDVNGLAASLEIYFGEDVLIRKDGTLTPIHWRGFDSGVILTFLPHPIPRISSIQWLTSERIFSLGELFEEPTCHRNTLQIPFSRAVVDCLGNQTIPNWKSGAS